MTTTNPKVTQQEKQSSGGSGGSGSGGSHHHYYDKRRASRQQSEEEEDYDDINNDDGPSPNSSLQTLEFWNHTLVQTWNELLLVTNNHNDNNNNNNNESQSQPQFTILPHFVQRRKTQASPLVLATHLGANKLDVLLTQVKWWNGPTSAAVYVKSEEDIQHVIQFLQNFLFDKDDDDDNSSSSSSEQQQLLVIIKNYLSLHIYLEKTNLPYPHNTLRKLAVEYLDGDYFVALDVDFIPNPNCHQHLMEIIFQNDNTTNTTTKDNQLKQKLDGHGIFVLPAFERFIPKNNATIVTEEHLPRSKLELIQMMKQKTIK